MRYSLSELQENWKPLTKTINIDPLHINVFFQVLVKGGMNIGGLCRLYTRYNPGFFAIPTTTTYYHNQNISSIEYMDFLCDKKMHHDQNWLNILVSWLRVDLMVVEFADPMVLRGVCLLPSSSVKLFGCFHMSHYYFVGVQKQREGRGWRRGVISLVWTVVSPHI